MSRRRAPLVGTTGHELDIEDRRPHAAAVRNPRALRKGATLRDGRVVHPDLGDPVPTREEYDYTPGRSADDKRPMWPTWLRRYILQRDAFACPKCGYVGVDGTGLSVHHKKEVIFGGDDHPDNLITLCVACHEEWTTCEPAAELMSFETWLALPPMRAVLFLLTADWPDDISAHAFKLQLLATFHNAKTARREKK